MPEVIWLGWVRLCMPDNPLLILACRSQASVLALPLISERSLVKCPAAGRSYASAPVGAKPRPDVTRPYGAARVLLAGILQTNKARASESQVAVLQLAANAG